MTKDEAAKLIPIMQAYVDGKEIQVYTTSAHPIEGIWNTIYDPSFNVHSRYRIKPREVKVKVYESPTSGRIFTVSEEEVVPTSLKFIKEVIIEV